MSTAVFGKIDCKESAVVCLPAFLLPNEAGEGDNREEEMSDICANVGNYMIMVCKSVIAKLWQMAK